MEICFADVGQGSCNLLLLGGNRAIVIDAGGQPSTIVRRLLESFHIDRLARLIVTHNHADHSDGAVELLALFARRIDEVWFLDDASMRTSRFFRRITEDLDNGRLAGEQVTRLERGREPTPVYDDGEFQLEIVAPNFAQNLAAGRNANSTSGVLLLSNQAECRVIFAGDSTIDEWRGIPELRGDRPIACDLVTVPHHGGTVWQRSSDADRIRDDLDWFYSRAIQPRYGLLSVGTQNPHGHPRPEVMAALRRASVIPICTQMTARCTSDLEAQRGRSLPILLPSQSFHESTQQGGESVRPVACAGTMLAELKRETTLKIMRYAEHQAMIDRLGTIHGGTPLYREPGSWVSGYGG